MKKLRLELDKLAVESFSTSRDLHGGRGTVRGQAMVAPMSIYYDDGCNGSWDAAVCYTGDGANTCQAAFTCPHCTTPPETAYTCAGMKTCYA